MTDLGIGLMEDVDQRLDLDSYIEDSLANKREGADRCLASIIQESKIGREYNWVRVRTRMNSMYNRPLIREEREAIEEAASRLEGHRVSYEHESTPLRGLVDEMFARAAHGRYLEDKLLSVKEQHEFKEDPKVLNEMRKRIRECAKVDDYKQLNQIAEELRDMRDLLQRTEEARFYKGLTEKIEDIMNEAREAQLHPKKKTGFWGQVRNYFGSLVR